MDLEETFENPAFWILGGFAVIAELIGWIISKRSADLPSFPAWQFIVLVVLTLVISAVIANRD